MLLSHSSSLPASSGTAAVNGLTTLVHTRYRSCHRPTVAFTPSVVGRSWGPAQHAAPAFAFAASGHWGQITANKDGNITPNSCKSTPLASAPSLGSAGRGVPGQSPAAQGPHTHHALLLSHSVLRDTALLRSPRRQVGRAQPTAFGCCPPPLNAPKVAPMFLAYHFKTN